MIVYCIYTVHGRSQNMHAIEYIENVLFGFLLVVCINFDFFFISVAQGIVRTKEEQHIEAIEILSLAAESAAAKTSKLLGELGI